VHLGGVRELHFVRDEPDGMHLGPLVTLAELESHDRLRKQFPALAHAAGQVAGPQLRNMGTLGGNLCLDTRCTYYNQTYMWRQALGFCLKKDGEHCHVVTQGKRCVAAHSSDVAPMLIALRAEIEIAGAAGRRTLPVEDFFIADGVHNQVLESGELVTRIFVPDSARGLLAAYRKLRPRGAIDFPMLSIAFAARGQGALEEARLVVSALAAKPRVVGGLDRIARGKPLNEVTANAIAEAAYKQCRPQTNVPYDTWWRHEMVPVLVRRTVLQAFGEGA
jgi:4-hydroxybenzoyl-CoA reductase subunit beta